MRIRDLTIVKAEDNGIEKCPEPGTKEPFVAGPIIGQDPPGRPSVDAIEGGPGFLFNLDVMSASAIHGESTGPPLLQLEPDTALPGDSLIVQARTLEPFFGVVGSGEPVFDFGPDISIVETIVEDPQTALLAIEVDPDSLPYRRVLVANSGPETDDEGLLAVFDVAKESSFFAQFGNGGGLTSELVLVSSLDRTISGRAEFVGDDGQPLEVGILGDGLREAVDFVLPARGTETISTDGEGDLAVGSVRLTHDAGLGAVVRFGIVSRGIAGVGESPPATGVAIPVRSTEDGLRTGVAIRNAFGKEASLIFRLREPDGRVIAELERQFPANGHLARFVDELFPDETGEGFEGVLDVLVKGGGKIGAIALEFGTRAGEFTVLPVTPLG